MANWANTARLGDPSAAGWQDQNLTWIEPVPGQRWQVYKPAAEAFTGLLTDLIANGYKPQSSGGFNYRNMRGGNKLSQHAFGTAIDINAAANPFLGRGQAVVTDLPSNTADLAKKWGLEWGGTWSRPDAMHFEWAGDGTPSPPAGNGQMVAGKPLPTYDSLMNPPAGAQAPKSIAGMFTPPVAPGALQPAGPAPAAQAPQQPFGQMALLFAQQQAQRQQQRQEEADAEQERRRALFGGGDSLAGLFGAA